MLRLPFEKLPYIEKQEQKEGWPSEGDYHHPGREDGAPPERKHPGQQEMPSNSGYVWCSLDRYPGVQLLDHMIVLLIFLAVVYKEVEI